MTNQQSLDFSSPTLYRLLKKNAPLIFSAWIHKKLRKLKEELLQLRYEYKHTEGGKKEEIRAKGEAVRQTIENLQRELL
jgi:hypothetical protein